MKNMIWKKMIVCLMAAVMVLSCLSGCGKSGGKEQSGQSEPAAKTQTVDPGSVSAELTHTGSMPLDYATQYTVDYYEGDYALITIAQRDQYLLVPEGKEAPKDLASGIVIIQQPVDRIYLVASSVMDMFAAFDGIDALAFTGTEAKNWYIEEAKQAMEAGKLVYAGKYSAPDYEMIISGKCNLAIENTMIYHTPEVKEQLEKFGIPVMVDNSSYEENPLGRCEWVKLYGLLSGYKEAAEEAFARQEEEFNKIKDKEKSGKKVAFFYITTDGQANVRKSNDYLAKMINMAGGEYIFSDLGTDDDSASSTMSMTMEEFYAAAVDADYIIYNSTIEGDLENLDSLLALSNMLEKFKAVKEGHVYCTTKNLYQSSMELGTIIADIYHMLNGEDGQMTYLYKLE